jgi:hypothetical protein
MNRVLRYHARGRYNAVTAEEAARGKSVLITGGIGDFWAVESMMAPETREQLTEVYYAAPAGQKISGLMRALPPRAFPRLRSHVVLPTGIKTYYSKRQVVEAGHELPPDCADYSIEAIFPLALPNAGSSFLRHRVAVPAPLLGPYAVVAPASGWYMPEGRGFSADDWAACMATLEKRGLRGVVFGPPHLMPNDPRLSKWEGGLAEAAEVCKSAEAYIGIDTCWSVLAAQLLPAGRLSIKCINPHGQANARSYFAPWTTFEFLSDRIRELPWQ